MWKGAGKPVQKEKRVRKTRIFISYCGADTAIKDELAKAISELDERLGGGRLEIDSMDSHGQVEWDKWMIEAIYACDIVIPILTENSMRYDEGTTEKRVYDEVRTARDENKPIIPLAFCEISPKMRAHVGSFVALSSVESVVEKLEAYLDNGKSALVEGINLNGLHSAQSNINFVGRKSEFEWIENTLDKTNVVILTGDGGIGKTTLAECFFQAHKDKYKRAYIVDASNGVRQSIIDLPIESTKYIKDESERYTANKRVLSSLDDKYIFILDNCDIKIKGEDIDDIIDKLRCRFIITSRVGDDGRCAVEKKEIGRMSDVELLELVLKHNPSLYGQNEGTESEINNSLFELFASVGGHTMTVEMASAIMENAWVGLDEIKAKLFECEETAQTRKFDREETIIQNLTALYDFARLNETEKQILNAVCLIAPSVGIEFPALKELLELKNATDTRNLIKNTLLKEKKDTRKLHMHPLFADVYYTVERVYEKEEYDAVKDRLLSFSGLENVDKNNEMLVYFAEKRSDGIKGTSSLAQMYVKIADGLNLEALFLNEIKPETAEVSSREFHKQVTEIKSRARSYAQRGAELYVQIYENGKHAAPRMGLSSVYAAEKASKVYSKLREYEKALYYAKEALNISLKMADEDSLGTHGMTLASAYTLVSDTYHHLNDDQKAVEYGEKAHKLRMEILAERQNDGLLAGEYLKMSSSYSRMGEYAKAVECAERALKVRLTLADGTSLYAYYERLGEAYLKVERYDEAIESFKKAVEAYKENNDSESRTVSFLPNIYNRLARVCRAAGRFEEALEYYEKAIDTEYELNNTPRDSMLNQYQYRAMAKVYICMGEYAKAVEVLERANKSIIEYYKNKPTVLAASSSIELAEAYMKTGQSEKALEKALASVEIMDIVYNAETDKLTLCRIYETVADIYEALGESDKAQYFRKKAQELKD